MADNKSKLTLVQFNKASLMQGRHILIVESADSRRAVALNINVFSIGRHPHNSLVLTDQLVSRHHATIAWMKYTASPENFDYAYWIIDGKGKRKRSRNGISINGKKKPLHRLVSGDQINLGTTIKITYNYIAYSTDTQDFLEYCDGDKTQYSSLRDTNYKETVIFDKIP